MKRSSTTSTPTIHRKGGQALGSSNYLSDVLGEAYQHVEYLPWGETFLEERNTQTDRNTYLYTGKELDLMTGLYYYEQRYFDPNKSTFLGVDPLAEKRSWVSPYNYCQNNPIARVDPTGALDGWIEDINTGELRWDDNVNSQKEFDESGYDKSKYSYEGQELQRAYSLGSTAGLYTQYYGTDGNTAIYDYPMWIEQGRQHIGLTEGSNATIQTMIDNMNAAFGYADKTEKPINSDADPWCGVFVYDCLTGAGQSVNQKPKTWQTPALNTFYSNNWEEGTVLSSPTYGAIAVMSYGHVAMVVGYNDKYVWILGGNQPRNGAAVRDGVEVNITRYNRSLVSKYVIPTGYNAPPLGIFK